MDPRSSGVAAHGELVLRVRGRTQDRDECLLLEKRLQFDGWRRAAARLDLRGRTRGDVCLELWADRSTGFLQFVSAWSVDLQQWVQSGRRQRWFEVEQPRSVGDMTPSSKKPQYVESAAELRESAAYVCVTIVDKQESKKSNNVAAQPAGAPPDGFHFVLPHRSLARSAKFRAARVGEIVHERRADILYDLMPVTLFGRDNSGGRRRTNSGREKGIDDEIAKALVMLQLSCQYVSYCVNELERHTSTVDRRACKYMKKANRLKQRQKILKEKKTNLQHESQVLSCSLDEMRMLLEEIDPEALTKLHLQDESGSNTQLQEVTDSQS